MQVGHVANLRVANAHLLEPDDRTPELIVLDVLEKDNT
jgi:hypothetical protein